jgi:hypothetical protein
MKTLRKHHHVQAYKNPAWNLVAAISWTGTEYSVTVEPLKPTPHFLHKEPQKFPTLEMAIGAAKEIAGQ